MFDESLATTGCDWIARPVLDKTPTHGSLTRPVFIGRVDLNAMARGGMIFVTACVKKF